MTRLLIGFDGSPAARTAIERAAALFPAAEAIVASVASGLGQLEDSASPARMAVSDDVIRTAVARLREATLAETRDLARAGAALAAEAGLQATPKELPADAPVWRALLDAADEADAGAVVCGTHGRGAVMRALLGSVSTGLVHHAGRPVLVVPEEAAPASGPLLIAFDDSDHGRDAVAACGAILPGRSAVVLHGWRSQVRHALTGGAMEHAPLRDVRETVREFDTMLEDWSREEAERGAALAGESGLDARGVAVESRAPLAKATLEAADEHDAAIIVVGRRGRGAVKSAVLGSVSEGLLHASGRPLLVA